MDGFMLSASVPVEGFSPISITVEKDGDIRLQQDADEVWIGRNDEVLALIKALRIVAGLPA